MAVELEYEYDIGSVMVGQLHQQHTAIFHDRVANTLSQMASNPPLLSSRIIFLFEEVIGDERKISTLVVCRRWKATLQQVRLCALRFQHESKTKKN